jgi:hypothetical protein
MLAQIDLKTLQEFIERVGIGAAFALGLLYVLWNVGQGLKKSHADFCAAQTAENQRNRASDERREQSDERQERALRGVMRHQKAVVALVTEIQKQTAGCPGRLAHDSPGTAHGTAQHTQSAAG